MSTFYWAEGVLLWITLLLPFVLVGCVVVSFFKWHRKPLLSSPRGAIAPLMSPWNYVSYTKHVSWPVGLGFLMGMMTCWLYVASCWSFYHSIPSGTTATGRFGFGLAGAVSPCIFLWLPLSVADLVLAKRTGRLGVVVGLLGILLNLSSFFLLTAAEGMTMDYYHHIHHVWYQLED